MGDTVNEHCHYFLRASSWPFDLLRAFFLSSSVALTAMEKVPMSY